MAVRKLNLSGHDNSRLEEMGFETHKIHVDLADPELTSKVRAFILNLGITSEDVVYMAAPGLAPLALIVASVIHGLTGQFPSIIPMIRGEEGFVPGDPIDLQNVRNDSVRPDRSGMTVL